MTLTANDSITETTPKRFCNVLEQIVYQIIFNIVSKGSGYL
jgi:hypothetical protein